MTTAQWETICLHLDSCFAGEWDDAKEDAYASFLRPMDYTDVGGAIRVLMEGGQRFTPSVGEILGVLDQVHGPPPFDSAWRAVGKAMTRYGAWGDVAHAERALADEHPIVLGWVRQYGWDRLARERVNDPDHGGAVVHRLGVSYRDYAADTRMRERAERRGLPGARTGQLDGARPRQLEGGS